MTSVADIFQLTLKGTYLGQECANIFHYKLTGLGTGAVGSEKLSDAFKDSVLPAIREVSNLGVLFHEIYTLNLADLTDFHTDIITLDGSGESDPNTYLPSYVTLAFRYVRANLSQRDGGKRFYGVADTQVDGNEYAGLLTPITALETALKNPVGDGGSPQWIWYPFVARRPITYGTNPTGYLPSNITFTGVTTQLTRRK